MREQAEQADQVGGVGEVDRRQEERVDEGDDERRRRGSGRAGRGPSCIIGTASASPQSRLPTASCSTFSSLKSVALEEAADPALVHDRDAVADADHLLHVAGDHQDGDAGVGQPAHQLVDLASWRRRRCRASARRRSSRAAASTATWPARPSAGCRRRARRPASRSSGARMSSSPLLLLGVRRSPAPPRIEQATRRRPRGSASEMFSAIAEIEQQARSACGPPARGRCRVDRLRAAPRSRIGLAVERICRRRAAGRCRRWRGQARCGRSRPGRRGPGSRPRRTVRLTARPG